jgi:hypothetical protein
MGMSAQDTDGADCMCPKAHGDMPDERRVGTSRREARDPVLTARVEVRARECREETCARGVGTRLPETDAHEPPDVVLRASQPPRSPGCGQTPPV